MQEFIIKASILAASGGTDLTTNAFGVINSIIYVLFWAFVLGLGALCVYNIYQMVSAIIEKGAYKDNMIASIAALLGVVAMFIIKAQIITPALSGMQSAIGTASAVFTAFLWW
jgi:hypothetical protein